MQLTQSQWSAWARQRLADAQKIGRVFEKQGRQVQALLLERGCSQCDPHIELPDGEYGGPKVTRAQVQHELWCPSNG